MVRIIRSGLAFCIAVCGIWIGASRLDARQSQPAPELDQTVQYIVNLVNTQSGAMRVEEPETTTWAYSMASTMPCTLSLTEERQTVRSNVVPVIPVRETTHYVIPAADIDFGSQSTRALLQRDGSMRVRIFTTHATIRRWYGATATMPVEAEALFGADIDFGKPNVDNFDIPVRFQNALRHLTSLCQAAAPPDVDPFRPR